ncbi:MAG: sensor histidine kinase [Shimia sp.]|uniref:sensor histidine kinase n=1 Tax=Shimia sp. TaxID=1954381 RepID=UPI004059C7B5
MRRMSLRGRLFVLILAPLTLMAVLLGYWRYSVAQTTAQELFDRSLLSAALAIARDVAVSEGDAISPTTRDLIADASGGEVFYHATGPGGICVTGYASPPVNLAGRSDRRYEPQFFQADYRGEAVQVLQITERVTFENLTADATVTVWQRLSDRNAFAAQLAAQAAALIGVLLGTLAVVVWFGVKVGLRPLTDLQDAIDIRSADDLSRIRRRVPQETREIVRTLNRLFGQVERSIDAHQAFISDAAHQLRNPAAAVQSMAEAVRDAKTVEDRDKRVAELVVAAKNSARVAEQLLSLDRLQNPVAPVEFAEVDLRQLVQEICADLAPQVLSKGVDFDLDMVKHAVAVSGDEVILAEAVKNLIDNALKHGGDQLGLIEVVLRDVDGIAEITVSDDGKPLSPSQRDAAFGRFSQVEPSDGSGLGLAIVYSVAERHGGDLVINDVILGASLTLSVPVMA